MSGEIISVSITEDSQLKPGKILLVDSFNRQKFVEAPWVSEDRLRILSQTASETGEFGPCTAIHLSPVNMQQYNESLKIEIGCSEIDESTEGRVFLKQVPTVASERLHQRFLEKRTAHVTHTNSENFLWSRIGSVEQIIFDKQGNCELVELKLTADSGIST